MMAVDSHTGEFVALKHVHMGNISKEGIPKAALREVRALQQLDHQNVGR
jgi:serine/threonine protein kinase